MAARPGQSVHGKTAISAAALVLLAWLSAPVLAAPDLSATPINNNDELLSEHLLRPRAESAVRSAFADDAFADDVEEAEEPEPESIDDGEDVLDEAPVMPSAFGREPSPFKRQMYRRDI